MAIDETLESKLEDLRRRIRRLDSALIAFSGGVDSTFLMRICRDELGEKAVAVTASSPDYPGSELTLAKRVAKILGVKHVVYDPVAHEREPHRGAQKCRSTNLYSSLKCLAMRMKVKSVLDASHRDDADEGGKMFIAARQAGIRSPLLESQLSKAEVRLLAKEFGLPNWDMPSSGNGAGLTRAAVRKRVGKAAAVNGYLVPSARRTRSSGWPGKG